MNWTIARENACIREAFGGERAGKKNFSRFKMQRSP
jgi:hypothetical protein